MSHDTLMPHGQLSVYSPNLHGRGIVYLVGAGPGDPDLITLRGLRCLRQADVVVHDRLIHRSLLDEAPATAEIIDVGKIPGLRTVTQEEIHALLVDRARSGKVVVRLKGGDPFVFGRGGEEALFCAAAGIHCRCVPGISSSLAAPAAAGIPITHRNVAGSFAVVTVQRAKGHGAPDWQALARMDTLVLLMAVASLGDAVDRLIAAGLDAATPVAIIERATLVDQRVTTAPLEEVPWRAAEANVRSPAVVVVGEVVRLRSESVDHVDWGRAACQV